MNHAQQEAYDLVQRHKGWYRGDGTIASSETLARMVLDKLWPVFSTDPQVYPTQVGHVRWYLQCMEQDAARRTAREHYLESRHK